ncbi:MULTISPECIES: hypothetical protein [Vibrio]|uniref:hypothetical protein n=1 Tax=Vibrio TaxID=662 RepID=UPI0026188B78|nr:hypothetical protein [Vibrio antiquarius]MCR9549002.1 hypothetical protein [Vibrio antiquarius]
MNRLVIGVVAALLAIGTIGYQGMMIKALNAEVALANDKTEQANKNRDEVAASLRDSEASKQALIADLKHRDAVLAKRDAALQKSKQELAELSNTLRGLRKNDDEYKTWSQARVPDAVIRLLRHTRTGESDSEDGD